DADVATVLPDFRPKNPFGKPITLRELMSHRAGLVREPPVGNYFDPTGPGLAETIASLNSTALVYEPGTTTKYSNAGIAAVGLPLERVTGRRFPEYRREAILRPMGLSDSAFEPERRLAGQRARGTMWTLDGRRFDAPTFELGIAPAGCLYSTVGDLGKLIACLD